MREPPLMWHGDHRVHVDDFFADDGVTDDTNLVHLQTISNR